MDFLEYIKAAKIIEAYTEPKIEQIANKDVKVDITIKPFYAARNFNVKLSGHKGDNNVTDWVNDIDEIG